MLDGLLLPQSQRASLTEAATRYATHLGQAATFLGARGVTEAVARSLLHGCVVDPAPGHEKFEGWLSLPYVTPGGVVAIKFRCIADHDCKAVKCQRYDSPSGQKARLYNAGSLTHATDVVVVCEGELDAAVGQSQLGVTCVGTPGTTFLEHWPRCLADADRVLVVADNDVKEDGSNPGVKHAKDKVVKLIPGSELILPPAGLDLGEWVLRDGADTVKKAMSL